MFSQVTKMQLAKIIWILMILLAASCAPSANNQISILEKSNCDLPCWNNIKVGQTTQDEILQFLETSSDIDQKSIQIDNHPWTIFDSQIFFSFDQGGLLEQYPDIQVDISFSNHIVSELIVCGELYTTIGDIVEQIGEPESIISGDNLDGNRDVILINSTAGISYWYTTDKSLGKAQYEMSPETNFECLNLFEPTLYEEMMEVGLFSMGHYNAEETLRVMYLWDGYGSVDEKYPARQP
jgi:hypothetical protein